MRIGVFGGTFNPPHNGHVTMARAAAAQLGLDKLLLVPDSVPPHKPLPSGVTARQRYDMAALMAAPIGRVAEASDIELRRTGKSYTSDTLRTLREQYPDAELWLLMGSDMFLSLHTWHEPEVICELAHIGAFRRVDEDIRAAMEQEKPDSFLLGEVWEDGSNKIAYSRRRRYLLGRETHGLMNYPLRTAALDYIRGGSAAAFRDTMEEQRENYPPAAFYSGLNILGTHDTPRILTLLGADAIPDSKEARAAYHLSPENRQLAVRRLTLAAMLLYTFPGSPTLYYGDEAGMEGFEDPMNRRGFPWGREDRRLLALCRTLGKLRKERRSLQSGDITYLTADGGLLVYRRTLDGESTYTALNTGGTTRTVTLPWKNGFAMDAVSMQRFWVRNGELRIDLPPCDGVVLV